MQEETKEAVAFVEANAGHEGTIKLLEWVLAKERAANEEWRRAFKSWQDRVGLLLGENSAYLPRLKSIDLPHHQAGSQLNVLARKDGKVEMAQLWACEFIHNLHRNQENRDLRIDLAINVVGSGPSVTTYISEHLARANAGRPFWGEVVANAYDKIVDDLDKRTRRGSHA